MGRALALLTFLIVTFTIPFLLWGDAFERAFTGADLIEWLRTYGPWAGVIAIGLLLADIALPVPSSAVMAALGILYGPWVGGALATLGGVGAGLLAYGLCRVLGRPFAHWLLGEKLLTQGEHVFSRIGGWIVALSRWQPILPEVVACLAGMMKMPVPVFVIALVCGAAPLGFGFAWLGHAGRDNPGLTLLAAAIVPIALWLAMRHKILARLDRA